MVEEIVIAVTITIGIILGTLVFFARTDLSSKINSVQAIAKIIAIVVAGYWTYDLFVKERKHFPHANIEHSISHISLTPKIRLLRVVTTITNTGSTKMEIKRAETRIQRILPMTCEKNRPCMINDINFALEHVKRTDDRFPWPMIAQRKSERETSIEVEPGEKEKMDFEFIISSDINYIRVYSFVQNESKKVTALGWDQSTLYSFTDPARGRR